MAKSVCRLKNPGVANLKDFLQSVPSTTRTGTRHCQNLRWSVTASGDNACTLEIELLGCRLQDPAKAILISHHNGQQVLSDIAILTPTSPQEIGRAHV